MGKYQCGYKLLMCLVLATLCTLCLCQGEAANQTSDFLKGHNEARAMVGVDSLVWDAKVAAYSQSIAQSKLSDKSCSHLSPSNGPYGENQFWGGGKTFTATEAIQLWVSSKQYYNHTSNTCTGSANDDCLSYTQVVWRDSTKLGCAIAMCSARSTFIICNYDPPGNIFGESAY